MKDTADLQNIIIACERKVWDALVSGDRVADAAALADDFLGIYADGPANKAAHVGQLDQGATVQTYKLSGFHFRSLAKKVTLLAYRADFRRVGQDADEAMYVTSIWEHRSGGWMNTFSQDTAA